MYCVTILSLKDWFLIIGIIGLLIWLIGGYIWYKIKELVSKDTEDHP
jgi:hypothetical protein